MLGVCLVACSTASVGLAATAVRDAAHSLQAGSVQPANGRRGAESYWVLLDSLGQCPGTTLVREYVQENGDVGRQYATTEPLLQAIETVTEFYRNKMKPPEWQELELHAAVEAYQKGSQIFVLTRSGADDLGLPPGATLVRKGTTPADARFFFSIEAGPAR